MKVKGKDKKVRVVTLGCSKNLVDSENLVTQLMTTHDNVQHQDGIAPCDIVVVNTCGFIDAAKEESIQTILDYAKLKEEGSLEKLYVTGCLSQRYRDDLEKEIPEVDAFFGTMELPALLSRFNTNYRHELIGERATLTPPHYAYLKISEGCNRTCSFCAIPLMRGEHRSKPMDAIIREAQNLVARGVKEIILIAQELTYYGLDLYKTRKLAGLLEGLAEVKGLEWIRLHYAYPSKFPRDIFRVMAEHPNICNYIDMPIQHSDDIVLESMKRQITVKETLDLIDFARDVVPNLAFRTTLMVGFPTESDLAFGNLHAFVKQVRFDRLGVFEYSHEEDTPADRLKDSIPKEIKEQRASMLMETQRKISLELNEKKVGSTFRVLIDRKEGDHFYGRTEYDSPEVDNEVVLDAEKCFVRVGDFVDVNITDVTEYDLYGEVVPS